MSPPDTISCIRPFVVLEHLFCLNRTYLIDSWKIKILCLLFNCLSFTYTVVMNVFLHYDHYVSELAIWLQVTSLTHLVYLVYAVRRNRQCFETLKELDNFCGEDERYFLLKNKAVLATTLLFTSSISDILVWHFVTGYVFYSCLWVLVFSRECEFLLYGFLIESINLRLLRLDRMKPSEGGRAYRSVLLCCSKIYKDFKFRILSILIMKFLATIAIVVYFIIYSAREILPLALWRFLHWHLIFFVVCHASYRTSAISKALSMKLCARLALTHKHDLLCERGALRRWVTAMEAQKPTFGARSLHLAIITPLTLLDLSVTYILVILQLFNAYKI